MNLSGDTTNPTSWTAYLLLARQLVRNAAAEDRTLNSQEMGQLGALASAQHAACGDAIPADLATWTMERISVEAYAAAAYCAASQTTRAIGG